VTALADELVVAEVVREVMDGALSNQLSIEPPSDEGVAFLAFRGFSGKRPDFAYRLFTRPATEAGDPPPIEVTRIVAFPEPVNRQSFAAIDSKFDGDIAEGRKPDAIRVLAPMLEFQEDKTSSRSCPALGDVLRTFEHFAGLSAPTVHLSQ
jgi:hypothetical protein